MSTSLSEGLFSLTKQKSNETILENLSALSSGAVYLIEAGSHRLLSLDFQNSKFLGRSFEELSGEKTAWMELIVEPDRDGYTTALDSLVEEAENLDLEYRLHMNKRGDWIRVKDSIIPIKDGDDQIRGYLGCLKDDSFRIQAMDTLSKRSWGEVSTLITRRFLHDFNNTIAGVYSLSELYSEPGSSAESMVEAMGHIRESSVRAQNIVQKIRSLGSTTEEELSFYDMEKLILEQEDYILALLPKGTDLQFDMSGESLPACLDANRFKQALLHLASNARDAIGEESPQVTIRCRAEESEAKPDQKIAIIEFIDNGSGIREKDYSKLFEPFTTTKDQNRHSGMGLFIAKSFAEELGGEINMSSTFGEGTKVCIKLPVANLEETFSSPKPQTASIPAKGTSKPKKAPTILIYTWEDITRHPLITAIRNDGWQFRIHLDSSQLVLDAEEMKTKLDGILIFKSSLDENAEPLIRELAENEDAPKRAIIALGESIDAIPESIRSCCGLIVSGSSKPSGLLKKLSKFYC